MSYEALSWAMNQPLKITTRSVLMELASHYNSDTKRCDPSIERLQGRLLTSHVTILKSIKELISLGLISRKKRGPLTAFYTLNFNVYVKNTTNIDFIRTDQTTPRTKESLHIDDERTKESLEHELKNIYNKTERNFSTRTKESLPKTVSKQEVKTVIKTDKDSSNHSVQKLDNKKYSDQFELFWSHAVNEYKKCNSSTGNKMEAYNVWKQLRPTEQDVKNWARIITEQANTRKTTTENGGKIAPFKHVCRWLKYSGWEDIVEGWSTGYRKPEEPRSTLRMM